MQRGIFSVFVNSILLITCSGIFRPIPECHAQTFESIGYEQAGFEWQNLFVAGDGKAACYRIPAIVTTNQGILVAVCDARIEDCDDLPNNIDSVIRRSTDRGKTWSPVKTIVDYPEDEGAGDPCLLMDRQKNRIWLFLTYGDGIGWKQSVPGLGKETLQVLCLSSDDNGLTWSNPRNITKQVKRPEWNAMWTSPGIGIQLRSGRLLFGCSVFDENKEKTSRLMLSDDGGETWSPSEVCGRLTNENQFVELADGTVLINMRSNHEKGCRALAESKDGGRTWSGFRHDPQLPEPVCQASLIRYTSVADGGKKNRILFANPASEKQGDRRKMTVRLSCDEGKSWPVERCIHEGPSAYSCLTVLDDGSIGLLYEAGEDDAYESIRFARFSLEWLTGGDDRF